MDADTYYKQATARSHALFGVFLFENVMQVEPENVEGAFSVYDGKRLVPFTSMADLCAYFRSLPFEGARNLPNGWGTVVNEKGEITHDISPNGRLWITDYIGMSGGGLAQHPLRWVEADTYRAGRRYTTMFKE